MARTPVPDRPPLAQWLIRSRESLGLTAERFLEALRASGARAPHRSNYAQWESGRVTPEDASLAPVVAFHAARGIAGPPGAREPEPAGPSLEERAVLAAERQADALEAILELLRGGAPRPDPRVVEAAQAWARSADEPSRSPQADPEGNGGRR